MNVYMNTLRHNDRQTEIINTKVVIMLWSEWRASLVNRDWQIVYSLRNLPGACWFYQAARPSNRGRCEPLEILHTHTHTHIYIYTYIYIWCTFSALYSCMFTQQGCTTIWLNEFLEFVELHVHVGEPCITCVIFHTVSICLCGKSGIHSIYFVCHYVQLGGEKFFNVLRAYGWNYFLGLLEYNWQSVIKSY